MYYPFFDPTMLILIPAILLATFAQIKLISTYGKYANISSKNGLTGAEVAKELLKQQGINNVSVKMVSGKLTDHFNPRTNIVNISKDNYNSSSIAAISVAAHEVGHAIQHFKGYTPLKIRSNLVPIVNFSSSLALPLIMLGIFLSFSGSTLILKIGIFLFSFSIIFQLITLPVEFNASKRANNLLQKYGFLSNNEVDASKQVLNAAALTYVAATLTSVLQLVRLLLILNKREDKY